MDCPNPPKEPISNAKDARRILYLENRVKILKHQVITTLDKVERSVELDSKISSLEEQLPTLSSKITGLTECVGVLDTGVSRSTCSWATSTSQLWPRSAMKIEAQEGRPS
jgi:hypothetical protein